MATIFAELIGRNLEVYTDDILVKSLSQKSCAKDLEVAFQILLKFQMRLNFENVPLRSKPTNSWDISSVKEE